MCFDSQQLAYTQDTSVSVHLFYLLNFSIKLSEAMTDVRWSINLILWIISTLIRIYFVVA